MERTIRSRIHRFRDWAKGRRCSRILVEGLLTANAELTVRLILSDRHVHLVEEGVDVVVRIGALSDSSLMALRLAQARRVLVASPD